jgi:tripartite-type tricarboxylate transporter receptor subunit TctC
VKTIADVIALAKQKPGALAFASGGNGTTGHLCGELLKTTAKIDMLHVPYKGGGPATAAVVSGESAVYFACISAAIPHVKAGRLTLLGITSAKRSPLYPDTPAVAETLPGFEMSCDTGLFAPAGVPRAMLERVYQASVKGEENPRLKEILTANDAVPGHLTTVQFKEYVAAEIRSWAQVVKAANLKVD